MRDSSYDRTIARNYLQKWRFLIPEYEAMKAGRSEAFNRVGAKRPTTGSAKQSRVPSRRHCTDCFLASLPAKTGL
jgi:translation elongation factor P/translation initiation factor 5A